MEQTISETYIRESLKEARYFEFCADAERAQAVIDPILNNLVETRDSGELSSELTCEIFLVYGSVISYRGLTDKEKYLQETAMDFLSEARTLAFEVGKRDLIAEIEKQIGLCYWRLGQHDNAQVYFDTLLERYSLAERKTNSVCLATQIYLIGIYFDLNDTKAATKLFEKIAPFVEASDDKWLQTKFYSEAAGIQLKLGNFRRTIRFLEKAIELSRITKNDAAQANALNNLALVYLSTEDTGKAKYYIELAIEVFTRLEQTFTIGMALETKAQISIATGDFRAAQNAIDESIAILEKSENYASLAESLWTRILILARIGDKFSVITSFSNLIDLVKNHLSETYVNSYLEKISQLFYIETGRDFYEKTENYRRHLVDNALSTNGASVTRAAKGLGISHQNTSLLLKKYPDLCEKHNVILRKRMTDSFASKKDKSKNLL
jgi:tetratricopeptide (TPR) repeat protein